MFRFVHLVNPFSGGEEWNRRQEITLVSMLRAKKDAEPGVKVELVTTQYTDDHPSVPNGFRKLEDIDRSVDDLGNFRQKRKLPILQDLLDRFRECDAEYCVFSNADIALMPGFYKVIDQFAQKGYDAFVINRRCIPGNYSSVSQLEEMYAEAGIMHTGYDTFVFRKELLSKLNVGNVCVGIPMNDTILFHSLIAHAQNFRLFTEKHLTFHVGVELIKDWGDKDHYRHNRKIFLGKLKELRPLFRISAFPGSNLPFLKRHFKWLMNPTFHYPTMFILDLRQLKKPRKKKRPPEVPGFRQRYASWMIRKVSFRDSDQG